MYVASKMASDDSALNNWFTAYFELLLVNLLRSIFETNAPICCISVWTRSAGSHGNTWLICCPAQWRSAREARGTSPLDNKSRRYFCRNSPSTDRDQSGLAHDLTTLYQMYLRKNTLNITTKWSDVAYVPPFWRHASELNDRSCSFTHPIVKGRNARGTSPGTLNCVAS